MPLPIRYSQTMRIVAFKILGTLFLTLSLAGTSLANPVELIICLKQVADNDLANKVDFQNKMRDIIIKDRPDLEELATLQRDSQITRALRRNMQLHYLLAADPDRVVADKGLMQFRNFDWTEADQFNFLKYDNKNQELVDKVQQYDEKSESHPDWPKLREFFKDTLRSSMEYKNLATTFTTNQMDTKKMLEDCPK